MTTYHVTLRDRETQTVVGYYNGSWTTDWCHAVALRKRDARKPTPPACAIVQAVIRLDPHDPKLANRLNNLALGRYLSREYEAAVEAAKRAIRANPDFPLAYRWLAAALGQLGRTAEAKEALEQAIAISPASFDMYVGQRVPWRRREDDAHMLDGLRKAGWES